VRKHAGPKLTALTDYRVRYSQYRSDPLLRAMHQQCPWLVTWDDHEVENNYAADISQRKGADPAEFLLHRAAAYQAYYEMMPLRRRSIPRGPDLQLYRKASFGQLAEFLILDTRQYRTDQPNGDARSDLNAAALDPKNTLLGVRQREWLQGALTASPATWNVLAQQVMMALVDRAPGDAHGFSMDQWPSAAHERIELVRFMQERRVKNPVVLTGDIHSNWVNDLRVDDRKADTPVVATEFVGTSISSGGNGVDKPNDLEPMLAENPCVRFHNRQRGYVRCTVTPGAWRSDYVVVADVTKPGGAVSTRASFVVEAGHPGAKPA
jgi:alkaline phosphatase D